MPVTYIQDVSWQAVEDPVWTRDFFGVDHATVLYRGSRLLKPAFEKQLETLKYKPLDGFPEVKLISWGGTPITPSFPGIQLSYVGFRSGFIPDIKISDSLVTASASGSGTLPNTIVSAGVNPGGGAAVSGSFVYQAARTNYLWFAKAPPPKDSPYNTVSDTRDPLTRILQGSIQYADSQYPAIVPYSAFAAVFNKLIRRQFVSDYSREPIIPGQLWQCSAAVDYQVVS